MTVARVLVLNCGSSSVKYRLLEPRADRVLASGRVERIGEPQGLLVHHSTERPDVPAHEHRVERDFADHSAALDAVLSAFAEVGPPLAGTLTAVGHRVAHGGERFHEPIVVDDEVLAAIEELSRLAPLHNPAAAEGIRVARRGLPGPPHVAVFDTAFHASLPPEAATYAVPEAWRTELGVRRYGFHGTSHAYVSREAARELGRPVAEVNTIVLHLGNGASACAVRGGVSIDTSMGLTPLQGLVMGTRSGDVDPALPGYLARVAGLSPADVDRALNEASGLMGLAGAVDVREVTERARQGDIRADRALDVYCYRVRAYVGSYYAALGRVDAVVFTAGVGENSVVVRERSLRGLERLGIRIDPARNAATPTGRVISPDGAEVAVMVIPTNEEREIGLQTLAVVGG